MSKIGLVVEGGGMKCAYSAGVLDAFLDHDVHFPYTIGVSAGAANTASYLAGQRGRNRRFYTEHIKDKEYFGFYPFLKNGNMFNLQYIYGDLTNSDGKDPIDLDAVLSNPAELWITATDAETGKPHYFRKEEFKKDDFRILMATCAIPAICQPVQIDGRYYYDGGVSDSIPVKKAMESGCDKVVVITSKPHDYVKPKEGHRMIYTVGCARYPSMVEALNHRHIMYNEEMQYIHQLEKEGRAFVFAPTEMLVKSTYAMDPEENQKMYELGLQNFSDRLETFRSFMAG